MEKQSLLKINPNFTLHLTTAVYDFYCNLEESDENGMVMMFDKAGILISDNYFGYTELYEFLTEKRSEIIFSSAEMKYNMEQIDLEILNS